MARRRAARGRPRGGEGIQAPRPARARVTAAGGAVAAAAAVAAWLVAASSGTLRSATLLLVVPAFVALAGALALRRPVGIPVAIFLLGLAYTLRLLAEVDTLDGGAPLFAAALYVTAELAYWSLEVERAVVEEAGGHLRRLGLLAALALGTLVVGLALLTIVDVTRAGGVAAEAVGVAAAVAALALLMLSSRRTAP